MRIFILFFFITINCFSLELIKVREYDFQLPQNRNNLLVEATDIAVTEYGTVIISDYKDYNLKVYRNGVLIQTYGSKGIGPGEFCSPDKVMTSGNKLVVYDYKSRRLISLKLTSDGKIDESFFASSYNFCFDLDVDEKGNILLSGSYSDKSGNEFVLKDLADNTIMVESEDFLGDFYEDSPEGRSTFITRWKDHVYIAWRENLVNLSQYNTETEDLKRIYRGSKLYVPIYPNKKFEKKGVKKALKMWSSPKARKIVYDAKRGTCMVNSLHSGADYLFITCFRYPLEEQKMKQLVFLVFNHSGKMVGEFLLPEHHIDSYQIVDYHRKSDEIHVFTIIEKEESTHIKCTIMKVR